MAIAAGGDYTVHWLTSDGTPLEYTYEWKAPQPQITHQPSTTTFEVKFPPLLADCAMCGEQTPLDTPICSECKDIFAEFKEYFMKRKFKEMMDELAE